MGLAMEGIEEEAGERGVAVALVAKQPAHKYVVYLLDSWYGSV
jgi:hypothetical protein